MMYYLDGGSQARWVVITDFACSISFSQLCRCRYQQRLQGLDLWQGAELNEMGNPESKVWMDSSKIFEVSA